jgi:hypothetical protein
MKLALALTALAKNSLGADGKIGIGPCPVAWTNSASPDVEYLQQKFVGKLVGSDIIVERRSRSTISLDVGTSGTRGLSVAKPRSSTSMAVLLRMTTPRRDHRNAAVSRKYPRARIVHFRQAYPRGRAFSFPVR